MCVVLIWTYCVASLSWKEHNFKLMSIRFTNNPLKPFTKLIDLQGFANTNYMAVTGGTGVAVKKNLNFTLRQDVHLSCCSLPPPWGWLSFTCYMNFLNIKNIITKFWWSHQSFKKKTFWWTHSWFISSSVFFFGSVSFWGTMRVIQLNNLLTSTKNKSI